MAYNSYYPATYQPMYPYQGIPYQQQQPIQQQPVQQVQQAQQIQYGNVVVVPSEQDVDAYPVAPGNCVTFKVENANILITKTKPFSALADPIKERYVLYKEDIPPQTPEISKSQDVSESNIDLSLYAKIADFEELRGRIDAIEEKLQRKPKKKGETDDD